MHENDELIQKYLNNSLLPEEVLAFEKLKETDAAFAQELAEQLRVRAAIHLHNRAAFKQQLQSIDAQAQKGSFTVKAIVAVAASVLLVVGIFSIYTYQTKDTHQLYASYYSTAPNVVAPVVRGEAFAAINDTLQQAFALYEEQKYAEAITFFALQGKTANSQQIANFYTAMCYMELGKPKEAMQLLTSEKFSKEPYQFFYAAQWYAALCYLQLGEPKAAKKTLYTLTQEENIYQQQSEMLLKEL
ncbi:MAG: hypothetical protein EAY68_11190 [Bacteroidetes bacterium]|nr:MAG: hypothetical protein EAY68_11190 [Bacteroidota bacterium]